MPGDYGFLPGMIPCKSRHMSAAAQFPWLPDPKDPKTELRLGAEITPFMLPEAPRTKGVLSNQDSSGAAAEEQGNSSRVRPVGGLESVGRLAGAVAHDFNNLLTGILLYCDLLATLQTDDRVGKYAQEIRNASLQATGLVQQLLAVARPMSSAPRLLSLNDTVECMRNLLERLIGENIKLRFHLDPNLGLVRMDSTQAQQMLLNLALNARDAMPAGGQITVETRNCRLQILADPILANPDPTERDLPGSRSETGCVASLPCALFVVGDNGIGMDAETRSHLFEAFFTTKPAGKGTGLGLATVHDIVTGCGGLIHLDSAPGRGTRVTVFLPLAAEAQTLPQVKEEEKNEGEFPAIEKEVKP
jgi:two-component system cell cycle sensor histidine kinase/response regulator CckA